MVKRTDETVKPSNSQLEKFKKAAREVETDDSEEAFDRNLKRVAKTPPVSGAKVKKAN